MEFYNKEEREKILKEKAREVVEKYNKELHVNEIDYFINLIVNDLKFYHEKK